MSETSRKGAGGKPMDSNPENCPIVENASGHANKAPDKLTIVHHVPVALASEKGTGINPEAGNETAG